MKWKEQRKWSNLLYGKIQYIYEEQIHRSTQKNNKCKLPILKMHLH